MTTEQSDRNAFEAVCELASRENWCWRMSCTTCGHMHWQYGLLELSAGRHPDTVGWVTRKSYRGSLSRALGELLPERWEQERTSALVDVLAGASLSNIAALAKFPDWLGYLGLALDSTSAVEVSERRLTKAWVPQLQELCRPGSDVVGELQSILDDDSRVLRWGDLEDVERVIQLPPPGLPPPRSSQPQSQRPPLPPGPPHPRRARSERSR